MSSVAHRHFGLVVFATALVAALTSRIAPLFADEIDDAKQRLQYMRDSAQVYDVETRPNDGRPSEKLKVLPEPLLRWTNPVSGVPDGTLFLWLDEGGRPGIAAQVFICPGTKDLWLHEFQSLSESPFQVQRDRARVWAPRSAGVAMKELPEAPKPANSKTGRLAQMRSLAQRFQASDEFEGKSRWELRLLTTPLHRYGADGAAIADGALFCFAHGTDPEVLLLLEARQIQNGLVWQYGLAPMTGYALSVKDRETVVWSVDWRKSPTPVDQPYFITEYRPAR